MTRRSFQHIPRTKFTRGSMARFGLPVQCKKPLNSQSIKCREEEEGKERRGEEWSEEGEWGRKGEGMPTGNDPPTDRSAGRRVADRPGRPVPPSAAIGRRRRSIGRPRSPGLQAIGSACSILFLLNFFYFQWFWICLVLPPKIRYNLITLFGVPAQIQFSQLWALRSHKCRRINGSNFLGE